MSFRRRERLNVELEALEISGKTGSIRPVLFWKRETKILSRSTVFGWLASRSRQGENRLK